MAELLIAGIVFVLAHLGISSTPLRALLVGRIGEGAYRGLYSLIAAVTLVWLVMTYNDTSHFDFLWGPDPRLRWVPLLAMPIALVFMLGGFMARNPTAVGQEGQIGTVGEGTGLVRITRHPFQWSVVLWSASHVIANGDVASLVFFGSLGTLSLLGTFLIDLKKARSLGADWRAFAAVTSNLPFAAILAGRNRLVVRELWLPVLAGCLAYALLLHGHSWVSGVALW